MLAVFAAALAAGPAVASESDPTAASAAGADQKNDTAAGTVPATADGQKNDAAAGTPTVLAERNAGSLQEVIVTANKQEQLQQKAPAAITAIDGESLVHSGITDIRAVQDFVPSVRFQQENDSTEIYIRGVGSTLDFPQITPPNSFNLNGVSVPREATSVPLYDIGQIEVLPGPQGTLYGSSALGGAVNVNFRRPTMQYETSTVLEVGDYGTYHVSAAQNLPLGDALAVRAALDYLRHDGYMTSGADSPGRSGRPTIGPVSAKREFERLPVGLVGVQGRPSAESGAERHQSGDRQAGSQQLSYVQSLERSVSGALCAEPALRPAPSRAAELLQQDGGRPNRSEDRGRHGADLDSVLSERRNVPRLLAGRISREREQQLSADHQ